MRLIAKHGHKIVRGGYAILSNGQFYSGNGVWANFARDAKLYDTYTLAEKFMLSMKWPNLTIAQFADERTEREKREEIRLRKEKQKPRARINDIAEQTKLVKAKLGVDAFEQELRQQIPYQKYHYSGGIVTIG